MAPSLANRICEKHGRHRDEVRCGPGMGLLTSRFVGPRIGVDLEALVWVSLAAAIPGKRLLVPVLMENREMARVHRLSTTGALMLRPVGSVGPSVGVAGLL